MRAVQIHRIVVVECQRVAIQISTGESFLGSVLGITLNAPAQIGSQPLAYLPVIGNEPGGLLRVGAQIAVEKRRADESVARSLHAIVQREVDPEPILMGREKHIAT